MASKRAYGTSRDARIAEYAAAQHGLVTTQQLRAAGLGSSSIAQRLRSGRMHRVHRGVYSVGQPPASRAAEWMGAVLACGPGAALSHRSAAALWGLLNEVEGPIDVSVPTQNGRRRRKGIRVHRRIALRPGVAAGSEHAPTPAPLTVRDLIPVTAPWLTIEDLRHVVPAHVHRRAIREAEAKRFWLGPRSRGDRTRSDPERDFLALRRRCGFPRPEVNERIGRWTVDFLWRAERVVVEVDTWRYHGGSIAFEDDHERDIDLRRRGFDVRRYTDLQIRNHPNRVATDLQEALEHRPRPPDPS